MNEEGGGRGEERSRENGTAERDGVREGRNEERKRKGRGDGRLSLGWDKGRRWRKVDGWDEERWRVKAR